MGALFFASLLCLGAPSGDADACVGFLEYNRLDPEAGATGPRATVTAAFKRDGKQWTRADVAQSMRWTVAFDGKRVGAMESTPAGKYEIDADSNLGTPDDEANLPKVGKPTREFAGGHNGAVLRPLVLVSTPNYRDPQGWRVKKTSASSALLAKFRKDTRDVRNCKGKDDQTPRAFHFTDKQVLVTKAYQANTGARIVGLQLDAKSNRCDGPADAEWQTHWYLVPAHHGAPVLLGDSLVPLDAGDYDGDGQSEFVFTIQRHDEDGYVLFYDGMRKHVEYTWSP